MAARLEVKQVVVHAEAAKEVPRFHLESPQIGLTTDSFGLRFLGWFICGDELVHRVTIDNGAQRLDSVAPVERLDVCAHFPEVRQDCVGGFEAVVPVLETVGDAELSITFHWGTHTIGVASVLIHVTPLEIPYEPRRSPVLLTSGGRVGSSAMMALIAAHPEVVTQGKLPYEDKSALYWMRACAVLTMPSDLIRSTRGQEFERQRFYVGHSPFCSSLVVTDTNIRTTRWHRDVMPRLMYEHFMRIIDSYYDSVAEDEGHLRAVYFVEKAKNGMLPSMVRELYPKAKEIFLIRDPRDMYVSIVAFNKKRGFKDFQAQNYSSEREYIAYLGNMLEKWAASWTRRAATSLLVKYEDLIADPAVVARRIFEYLGVSADDQVVANAAQRAFQLDDTVRAHVTSASISSSVNRWRTELSPDLINCCEAAFHRVLTNFGYC